MDIVGRIKKFIVTNSIPVTQFADNCNISRSTLSQLLGGRNKKVSDEIISKIHTTYPNLSIYWLLFGEGNMMSDNQVIGNGAGLFQDLMENSVDSDIPAQTIGDDKISNSREDVENLKRITKIVVFYNDNSYESFGPGRIV